jgi:FtsZ-interacting cell division protein ZipA
MSELQIWLLVLGVVVVVVVVAFNWLQERRFRKQAEVAFQPPSVDPLARADVVPRDTPGRVEPAFDAAGASELPETGEPRLHIDAEPVADMPAAPADVPQVPPPAAPAAALPPAPYDDLIEYRVRLACEGVLANVFADAFGRSRALGKTVRWLGLPVGGVQWEELQPWRDVHYQQVVVTMQLADRNGAVELGQLSTLCELLQATAHGHGLRIACDDAAEAVERAQAIDHFCVDVDVLIGLNVMARGEGAVNLARIVGEAVGNGMVLGTDGVFQLIDSRGEPLYTLCNHDAEPFGEVVEEGQVSQGVTLQFDVPRVPDGLRVFDGMVAFGRKLANEVGGILVDDNLRPLTDSGIEKIRAQLAQIYERMEARGVPSGSRRALRLFT